MQNITVSRADLDTILVVGAKSSSFSTMRRSAKVLAQPRTIVDLSDSEWNPEAERAASMLLSYADSGALGR
jgi:hypothetical protein